MLRSLRAGVIALAVALIVAACSGSTPPSFDPTGVCNADGRAAGAYPDLEVLVPTVYQDVPPVTLDSGRNCSTGNLGSLASRGVTEIRFAGGTWTFGAERAAVLAVFRAADLDADSLAAFYDEGARANGRTKVIGRSTPTIAGRQGWRLDTKTGARVQTVVVWPRADGAAVNVVITNDLPDARIADAIDAYGGR